MKIEPLFPKCAIASGAGRRARIAGAHLKAFCGSPGVRLGGSLLQPHMLHDRTQKVMRQPLAETSSDDRRVGRTYWWACADSNCRLSPCHPPPDFCGTNSSLDTSCALQLSQLCRRLNQDRRVPIRIFPQSQEITIALKSFRGFPGDRIGTREL